MVAEICVSIVSNGRRNRSVLGAAEEEKRARHKWPRSQPAMFHFVVSLTSERVLLATRNSFNLDKTQKNVRGWL